MVRTLLQANERIEQLEITVVHLEEQLAEQRSYAAIFAEEETRKQCVQIVQDFKDKIDFMADAMPGLEGLKIITAKLTEAIKEMSEASI